MRDNQTQLIYALKPNSRLNEHQKSSKEMLLKESMEGYEKSHVVLQGVPSISDVSDVGKLHSRSKNFLSSSPQKKSVTEINRFMTSKELAE